MTEAERLAILERDAAVAEARHIEQRTAMDARFDHVEGSLVEIKSNLSRIVWLILSLVVAAIFSALLKGGAI